MARFGITDHAISQFLHRVQPGMLPHRVFGAMQEHAATATRMKQTTFSGQTMYRVESPLHAYVVKNDRAQGPICVTVLGPKELSRYDAGGMSALSPEVQAELDGIVESVEHPVPAAPSDRALLGLLAEAYVQLSLSTYQSPTVAALRSRMERSLSSEAIMEAQTWAGYYGVPAEEAT
jgi:hypothetical protein